MKRFPKVTVVTVCYNCHDVIEQTLRNVLKQTYLNLEYIVIDGASTDGTRHIVERYAQRLAYWVSEPDKGIYDAMNKGIRAASGEWIIFRNAGDYFFHPTAIEDVFSWYDDHGETLITGGMRCFGADGYRDKRWHAQDDNVWHSAYIPHPATFIRMTAQKAHPYSTHYRIASDYRLFQQLMLNGASIALYDGIVALFDCEGGVSSRHLSLAWEEMLRIREELGAPQDIIKETLHRCNRIKITAWLNALTQANKHLYALYRRWHKRTDWTQQPLCVTLKDI